MSGAPLLLKTDNSTTSPTTTNIMSNGNDNVMISSSVLNVGFTEEEITKAMAIAVDMEDNTMTMNQNKLHIEDEFSIQSKLNQNQVVDDIMHTNSHNNNVTTSASAEQEILLMKSENNPVTNGMNGSSNGGSGVKSNKEISMGSSMRQNDVGVSLESSNGNGNKANGNHDRPSVINCDDEINSSCCTSDKSRLEQVIIKKRAERELEFARLQKQCKLDSSDLKKILGLQWEQLRDALQKRELTATEVLDAYISKALDSTAKFNNVTDFIPAAHALAKELDSLPEPKGPLHGIPFCVKDDTNVEGMDTTHGYARRLYKPASENAVIVKILMDLGGVPFCKTNVPQTLFTYGSDNPVFGTTTNATNPKLTPGGSSSGTGSLVGSQGALFGTGTDIGGSLRIPAHFNGVASIKPTVGRCSIKGVEMSLPNLVGLNPVPGIIGQTPTIVADVFEGLLEANRQQSYDPTALPIPWNKEIFESKEKLRIGYFTSLPYFPAMGDTEETVLKAKETLESLGHTLVPFTMPDQYHYMNIIGRFLLADHNRHFSKLWKGEKVADSVFLVWLSSMIPNVVQKFIGRLMKSRFFPFIYSTRTSVFFGAGACSSTDLWDAMGEKSDIIDKVLGEWTRLNLDTLICPLFPFAAPPVHMPGLLPVAVVYAMIWNLVDFPAGMVPFGTESGKNIDKFDHEGDVALKMAKQGIKESVGAPIGVQVVSLPYKEEMVLRVMKELENASKSQDS